MAVVEAMKMENVLRAEIDGTVKKINAKPGDSLAVDAVILEFALGPTVAPGVGSRNKREPGHA